MYGIGRIRDKDHVPSVKGCKGKMRKPLLRPYGCYCLCFRVYINIIVPLVPVGNGAPELGYPLGCRISMVLWVMNRLDKLFNDVRRGWHIGVSHPEVYDVLPCPSRLYL